MARLLDVVPPFGVELLNDHDARLRASFQIEWGIARDVERGFEALPHRLLVQVWGSDDGLRIHGESGGDDLLTTVLSPQFGSGTAPIEIQQVVDRHVLDEDSPRGALARRRRRTDTDEIYVRANIQVFGSFRTATGIFDRPQDPAEAGILPPEWLNFRGSGRRSAIIAARF